MKHAIQHGFGLIELLFAVAIIGILAAFAIPAYSAYLNRSRFSEGMIFAQKALQDVYIFYQQNGYFPSSNIQLDEESIIATTNLSQVIIGSGGNVCIIFSGVYLTGTLLFSPNTENTATIWIDSSLSSVAPSNVNIAGNKITPCETPANSGVSPSVSPSATPASSPAPTPSPDTSSWNGNQVYWGGDTITYNGHTYRANWWTQGQNPETNNGVYPGSGQPWTRLD